MILLFDSSRLNIGDLLYDESPVGSVVVGYHHSSSQRAGQIPSRVREGLDQETLAGFT